MTLPWQSPTPNDGPPPRYGDFVPPGAPPATPYGAAPGPLPGPPPGWTPPPKPGLIPLRPLGFGTLLSASFLVLRRNPKATFGSALIVQLVTTIATVVVVGLVTFWAVGRINSAPLDEVETVGAGATLTIVLSALVPLALGVVASAFLQGVIVVEVARGTVGEKLRMGALWRRTARHLWTLVLWSLLLSAAMLVAVAVLAGLVVLLAVLGGVGTALAILVGIFGGLALVAAAFWLFTKTSLVPSLVVLEGCAIRAAVRRSWALTTGYFWRTLGVQLLVAVIVSVVAQIVTTPLGIAFSIAVSLVDPNASFDAYIPSVILYVLTLFVGLVLGALGAVVQSAATALIYLDLRMRKEGLDLELSRYVESAQLGGDVPDPYLPPLIRT